MPQHKSEAKRMRSTKKVNERNRMARSKMRTMLAAVMEVKDRKKGEELLRKAFSILDKNVKKGVIHKNNAANRKGQLQKKINSIAA